MPKISNNTKWLQVSQIQEFERQSFLRISSKILVDLRGVLWYDSTTVSEWHRTKHAQLDIGMNKGV
jgi:hypothetical protein